MAAPSKNAAEMRRRVLAQLAEGYGVAAACKKVGVSHTSYYNWRKKLPAFKESAERILSSPVHKERLLHRQAVADCHIDASWQEKFIALYRRTGDRAAAASQSGVSVTQIANALDSEHKDFDKSFSFAFQEEQQRKLWKIEDNTLTKAEHDSPTARFVLSNLMKEKYGKVGGEVTVNQLHWYSDRGEQAAKGVLRDMFGEERASPVVDLADNGTT